MENRPRGREQHVTGQGKDVYKRGSGLGTGPVGSPNGYQGRGGSSSGGGGKRSGGLPPILIILAVLLFGGGAGFSGLLGGGGTTTTAPSIPNQSYTQPATTTPSSNSSLTNLLGGFTSANVFSGWTKASNTGKLDTSVVSGAREKYTEILGNQKDKVTIMVYMCGADLESRSGMATSDLQEMVNATKNSNLNVLVYTGGASKWNNSVVSSKTNQIYKIENGSLKRLEADLGKESMVKPETLTSFIRYCTKNYPANRQMLIFWDHGGGSISGYGYDENFKMSGSMNLKGINEALSKAKTKFDFIGFDACLMATLENALMLDNCADYLIASEETEPGIGWYYTNWLTNLAKDTSMPTIEIGKQIADDFVATCNQKCNGQKTTLSVVDLAELAKTVPQELNDFSESTLELMKNNQYKTVSDARSSAREFGSSSKVDQVDVVSLATRIGTKDAETLANAVLGAVKYNKTSSNMTDAYGLSIYFPYQKINKVNSAVAAYDEIGMDSDYAACIKKFAALETSGQAISGGATNPLPTLTGSGSTAVSNEMISAVLNGLLSGNMGSMSGILSGSSSSFLGKSLDVEADSVYLSENRFDDTNLIWTGDDPAMYLSEEQWEMVHDLELNVFVDDGEGYIDLGLDNVYTFTEDGGLSGTFSGTWLAINQQPVAYYHMDTVDDGTDYTITGRVPAMLNGERVNLILVFTDENPYGEIVGAEPVYESNVEVSGKNLLELQDGDVLDFLCDYYTYDGSYQDSYYLGDQMVIRGTPEISDVYLTTENVSACYRFTDFYQQNYWTPVMR